MKWILISIIFRASVSFEPVRMTWLEAPDFGTDFGDVSFLAARGDSYLVALDIAEPTSVPIGRVGRIHLEYYAQAKRPDARVVVRSDGETVYFATGPLRLGDPAGSWRVIGSTFTAAEAGASCIEVSVGPDVDLWLKAPHLKVVEIPWKEEDVHFLPEHTHPEPLTIELVPHRSFAPDSTARIGLGYIACATSPDVHVVVETIGETVQFRVEPRTQSHPKGSWSVRSTAFFSASRGVDSRFRMAVNRGVAIWWRDPELEVIPKNIFDCGFKIQYR
jgi:hypothetical protein